MDKSYKIAVVGASGLVGRTMVKILEERNFPVSELFLFASERSEGIELTFLGEKIKVRKTEKSSFKGIDIALFSAGKDASIEYAPAAAQSGCIVIDNGSYWRMDERVPLITPEVNPDKISNHGGIIANPNCSTIQLVVALKPILDNFGLNRVIVSTYQSVSGGGQKALSQLNDETAGIEPETRISRHTLANNAVFHPITSPDGFSVEEIKMINETRKILSLPLLRISTTCVRLPFFAGHGESVNIETDKPFEIDELRELFTQSPGIIMMDEPFEEIYPTPKIAENTDEVYIGRIRRDDSAVNGLHLWVVSDNLRKGAATNAVQIAEKLVQSGNLNFKCKF